MRFVLDENLPPRLAAWLIEQGHEAAHVRDMGLRSSPDRLIRDGSGPARSVIVSKDRDFVRIHRPQDGQVLHLTCGNLRRALFPTRFAEAWPDVLHRLERADPLVKTALGVEKA